MMSNFFKMPRENASSNARGGWSWLSTSLIAADRGGARVPETRGRNHADSVPGRSTWARRGIRLLHQLWFPLWRSRTGVPDRGVRDPRMLQHRLHL